jgi:hypothetical protein
MTDFNYKKAWSELAAPACMALSEPILQLVGSVLDNANNITQLPDLSVPWINDSLKEKFQKIPDNELASAAHIVWATGHWHPGADNWLRPLVRTGAYWKFSALADNILRERIKCDARNRGLLATRKTFNKLKPMIKISDNPNLTELELIVESMKMCRPNNFMLGFFNLENFYD